MSITSKIDSFILKERKHTPIVSERQKRFFGAEIGRAKAGEKTRTGMSEETLAEHLHEAAGKKLPETAKSVDESRGETNLICDGKEVKRWEQPKIEKANPYLEAAKRGGSHKVKINKVGKPVGAPISKSKISKGGPRGGRKIVEKPLSERINKFIKSVYAYCPECKKYHRRGSGIFESHKQGLGMYLDTSTGSRRRSLKPPIWQQVDRIIKPPIMKFLPEKIDKFIEKQSKIYLKPGEQPPKRVQVQRGKRGGVYFM